MATHRAIHSLGHVLQCLNRLSLRTWYGKWVSALWLITVIIQITMGKYLAYDSLPANSVKFAAWPTSWRLPGASPDSFKWPKWTFSQWQYHRYKQCPSYYYYYDDDYWQQMTHQITVDINRTNAGSQRTTKQLAEAPILAQVRNGRLLEPTAKEPDIESEERSSEKYRHLTQSQCAIDSSN